MITKIQNRINEIDDNAFLSPEKVMDVTGVGHIKLVPSVFTLYRYIRNGLLPAVNIGAGTKFPRYKIKGRELKKFLAERYEVKLN